MEKKYELTNETIVIYGLTLHRIRALRDISSYNVKAGDLGGYIEKEDNLSHEGCSWVGDNAKVSNNAHVSNNSHVCDDAWVCDNARVYDLARVFRDARVYDRAIVCGDAWVFDHAKVFGFSQVCGYARISGNAKISGNSCIHGSSVIYGNAKIYGNADISGNVEISGDAEIFNSEHYFGIGPIGSRDDFTTFYRNKDKTIWVNCGCFRGTIDDFLKKVNSTHGNNKYAKEYYIASVLAHIRIDLD